MTDTLAWLIMSWLLPLAGCAFFIFVTIGCLWLSIWLLLEIFDRVKMMFKNRR